MREKRGREGGKESMLSRGGILLLPRVVSVYLPFQKERKKERKERRKGEGCIPH